MVNFSTWFFNHFPEFFWENDSYKDGNGQGLLQRFLSALGIEVDTYVTPRITDLLNLTDVEGVESKHLTHLADILGNPPDMFGDETKYRLLLKHLSHINMYKGTLKGYQLIFGVLGVKVEIEEIALVEYNYDSGHQYDLPINYDSKCPPCSKYNLIITDPDSNCPTIGTAADEPEIFNLLIKIIEYVQPINLILNQVTYEGTDLIPSWILTTGVWDDSKRWNDSKYWRDTP